MSHGGEKRCPPRRLGCLWLGCSVEALRGLGVLTKTPTPCPGCWPSFLPTCQLAGESLWGRGADLELPRALPGAKPGGSGLLEGPGGCQELPNLTGWCWGEKKNPVWGRNVVWGGCAGCASRQPAGPGSGSAPSQPPLHAPETTGTRNDRGEREERGRGRARSAVGWPYQMQTWLRGRSRWRLWMAPG